MSYDPFLGYDPDEVRNNNEDVVDVAYTEKNEEQDTVNTADTSNTGNTGNTGNNGYTGYNHSGYNYSYSGSGYDPYANAQRERQKKTHPFAVTIGKAAAVALVFGLVSGLTFQGTSAISGKLLGSGNKIAKTETEKAQEDNDVFEQSDGDINKTATSTSATVTDVSGLVDDVMPAIVQVTNMSVVEYQNWFGQSMQYPQKSAGSGVIIDQDEEYLYIATNNHVVSNANSLTITFNDDKAVPAEVQGTQASSDLAVVKVKLSDINSSTMSKIKVATLGSSDSLKVGVPAIVIGNALGYGQSVTKGIVSALDREVSIQNEDDGQVYTNKLIQVDAAVNPGNSGGALLNMNGELVGIVSAKYSDEAVEGMGYAIPISKASSTLKQLMKKGGSDGNADSKGTGKAYLGIKGLDVTSDMAQSFGRPEGVYVFMVVDGSAAEKAGIIKGDIITKFDGKDITSMEQLSSAISEKSVGDKVKVGVAKVQNDFETVEIEIELGEMPSEVSNN